MRAKSLISNPSKLDGFKKRVRLLVPLVLSSLTAANPARPSHPFRRCSQSPLGLSSLDATTPSRRSRNSHRSQQTQSQQPLLDLPSPSFRPSSSPPSQLLNLLILPSLIVAQPPLPFHQRSHTPLGLPTTSIDSHSCHSTSPPSTLLLTIDADVTSATTLPPLPFLLLLVLLVIPYLVATRPVYPPLPHSRSNSLPFCRCSQSSLGLPSPSVAARSRCKCRSSHRSTSPPLPSAAHPTCPPIPHSHCSHSSSPPLAADDAARSSHRSDSPPLPQHQP